MYDTEGDDYIPVWNPPPPAVVEMGRFVPRVIMPDGIVRDVKSADASFPAFRLKGHARDDAMQYIVAWAIDGDTWHPVRRLDGENVWQPDPNRKAR